MDWTTLVPAIIGAFVGVMGWLVVGLYIQRRQFDRQARNAAKAVYFELDVNLATISVARDHGLFSDLDRSSFERLLPELATLLSASDLKASSMPTWRTPDTDSSHRAMTSPPTSGAAP